MRSTKFNILSLFFAVFSLFTVQGILYPFQEFRSKYRLEIVQNASRVRRRTCHFVTACSSLLKRVDSFSLLLLLRFALIIFQQHIHQSFKVLNKVFNSIKVLMMAFCRVVFNLSFSKDLWLPVHCFI